MGNPLRFSFWGLQFELREFWQQDFGSWGCGLIWLMFCEEALTPKWYDAHVWSLLRGNPLQFLFCSFHLGIGRRFRWHEASVLVIKPAQARYPSDMPMSEPIKRGNPLHFLFCSLQSEIERIWQEASQERHFKQDINLVGWGRFSWCVTLL